MNDFVPSKETLEKLNFIDNIQNDAENEGFKLWHCGSWAITAMLGYFFKDLKDVDAIIKTQEDKAKLSKIVEKYGFKFSVEHPWGPVEYSNGRYEIEFGSADDKRNLYYNTSLSENNYGNVNGIKLYIADPQTILKSRYEMIKAGYKKLDDTQKFVSKTIEDYIAKKSSNGGK
jgi:cytochrome oxidase Cu insertion factor (SCO1/SenC/PrrC family)